MENVKVILIKGKYQYKRQKSLYQGRILYSGDLRDTVSIYKLDPVLKTAVLTKKTPGDTHYIIMEG